MDSRVASIRPVTSSILPDTSVTNTASTSGRSTASILMSATRDLAAVQAGKWIVALSGTPLSTLYNLIDVCGRELGTGERTVKTEDAKLNGHIASQVEEQYGFTQVNPAPHEKLFAPVTAESVVHGFPIFAPPLQTPRLRQVNPAAHAAPVAAPATFAVAQVRISSRS